MFTVLFLLLHKQTSHFNTCTVNNITVRGSSLQSFSHVRHCSYFTFLGQNLQVIASTSISKTLRGDFSTVGNLTGVNPVTLVQGQGHIYHKKTKDKPTHRTCTEKNTFTFCVWKVTRRATWWLTLLQERLGSKRGVCGVWMFSVCLSACPPAAQRHVGWVHFPLVWMHLWPLLVLVDTVCQMLPWFSTLFPRWQAGFVFFLFFISCCSVSHCLFSSGALLVDSRCCWLALLWLTDAANWKVAK